MEMSGRPRRAALHQRSDSETNEIRTIPSLHSNNSSVSQKAIDVSSWAPQPTAPSASISRDSTRSSSRTGSISRRRGGASDGLRYSGSLDSLPPVAPLKINKPEPTVVITKDLPVITVRESPYAGALAGGSHQSPNTTPVKAQTFPKSILKKPSRAALPPYSTEEYNLRSSSWVGNSYQSPTTANKARMNARTLRIVRSEDDADEEGEEVDVVGGLISRERSDSAAFPPRTSPSSRLASRAGYSAQVGRTPPPQSLAVCSPGNASPERPGTASSLFASAKQLPAWARYFYGRKGNLANIIEPDMPKSGNVHDNESVGRVDSRIRRQQSDDSLLITEVILPGTAYHAPRRFASSESIPGLDWIGNRTRVLDPEVATQWSTPHLNHTPVSRAENIDRQVIMFCLGFILPVCWMIAAFLPLPEFHEPTKTQQQSVAGEISAFIIDMEADSSHSAEKGRSYESARWWRKVNRILSGVGLVIISAIIALGVVAATRGV